MPRKQRFKPSRKPKPIPQTEDAVIGREVSSAPQDRGDVNAREAGDVREDAAPPAESESDERAR
jgi:hypothetical protein